MSEGKPRLPHDYLVLLGAFGLLIGLVFPLSLKVGLALLLVWLVLLGILYRVYR